MTLLRSLAVAAALLVASAAHAQFTSLPGPWANWKACNRNDPTKFCAEDANEIVQAIGATQTYVLNREVTQASRDSAQDWDRAAGDSHALTYVSNYLDGVLAGGSAVVPKAWGFTADGATTQFSVPGADVGSASMYFVTVGGVIQAPDTDYVLDLAFNRVTFTTAPPGGAPVLVRSFGYSKGVNAASNSLVRSTGSTTDRSLADRFTDTINVRDFGATGNGATDDTAAFQAALAALNARTYYALFIPAGDYKITATLALPTNRVQSIYGVGAASRILGNVNGFVFQRADDGVIAEGPVGFEKLTVENSHASGGAINFNGFVQGYLRDMRVHARQHGLLATQNTFSLVVDNVRFQGLANTGRAITTAGHTAVLNCDIAGWDEGIRASGVQLSVIGGRYEVNKVAIRLGVAPDGSNSVLSRVFLAGMSFEANDTAIDASWVIGGTISGFGILGTVNAPAGASAVGVRVGLGERLTIADATIGGGYTGAAFRTAWSQVDVTVRNIIAGNTGPGVTYDLWATPGSISFQGCVGAPESTVLRSPNGTTWRVTVSDAGTLSASSF